MQHHPGTFHYSRNNQFQIFLIILSAQPKILSPSFEAKSLSYFNGEDFSIPLFQNKYISLFCFCVLWLGLYLFSFAINSIFICLYACLHHLKANYIKIYIMFHLSFFAVPSCQIQIFLHMVVAQQLYFERTNTYSSDAYDQCLLDYWACLRLFKLSMKEIAKEHCENTD